MSGRLLRAMVAVALVALLGFGLPLALTVQGRYTDEGLLSLSEEAARAAVAVPGSYAADNDIPELPRSAADMSVALYDVDGRRVVGRGPDQAGPIVVAAIADGRVVREPSELTVALPISQEEVVVGAIRASLPRAVVDARVRRTWFGMGLLAVTVLIATGLLAALLTRRLTMPLARVRDLADELDDGGTPTGMAASGIAEIDAVGRALTDASERLHEALARERAFSADVAHQLRTPVASLRLRLETEEQTGSVDAVLATDVLRDLDRLERTIEDLLNLARDVPRRGTPHPLATVVRTAAERWSPTLLDENRRVRVEADPGLPMTTASTGALTQILDVLLQNAQQHGDGDITIRARRVGSGAIIGVTDEGRTEIDPAMVFLRRNADAANTGIGLALARRLARAEGLDLVLSDPGPGPIFDIIVPAGHTRGVSVAARTDHTGRIP